MEKTILKVNQLSVKFQNEEGIVNAVRNVTFEIPEGKTLGLVGESGSGKSVTTKTILMLHDKKHTKLDGEILYNNKNILDMNQNEIGNLRGNEISMVFQDPMTSLNPLITVGEQVKEVILSHQKMSKKDAIEKVIQLFEKVGISSPRERYKQYPYELSGGMQQRIVIAIALACEPKILLADEPTTALDVTIQAEIIRLMKKMQIENNMAILMITHDLGVVANICDKVAVMYAGSIVEYADVKELFANPFHPYTKGLIAAMPRLGSHVDRLEVIEGQPPKLTKEVIIGCPFAERCKNCQESCSTKTPVMMEKEKGHFVCCNLYKEESME